MSKSNKRSNSNREKAFQLTELIDEPLDLYDYIPFRLAVVSNLLMLDRDTQIRQVTDLGPRELRVLLNIGSYMPIKAADIAYQSRLDSYTVSRAVKVLTGRGLVTAQAAEHNRKIKLLSLSEQGLAVYRQVATLADQRGQQLNSVLSRTERQQLKEMLSLLEDKIESLLAHHAGDSSEGALSNDQSELIRWHKRSNEP